MDDYQLLYELIATTLLVVGCLVGGGIGVLAFVFMGAEILGDKSHNSSV